MPEQFVSRLRRATRAGGVKQIALGQYNRSALTAKIAKQRRSTIDARQPAATMTLSEAMRALEQAGSEQTRKTYARHGATGPMFGVSFATLKQLVKRIGVDHELALELWSTGNHDARTLAVKLADPTRVTRAVLERWAKEFGAPGCLMYVAALAAESPHGPALARKWLAAKSERLRVTGWSLAGQLASCDERGDDAWFAELVARIEREIHAAPNGERDAMNRALTQLGGRSKALRRSAAAAARRIGTLEIDYGDTSCKAPDAASYLEKTWAHAAAKGFDSPAAQERSREPVRTRC